MGRIILYVAIFVLFASLTGCSTVSHEQKQKWVETTPICFNKPDCETKWAAARNWILKNSSYKIQIYSDDLIETYNPEKYDPHIGARVIKQLLSTDDKGEKSYAILASISCGNIFGCVPTLDEAMISFNNTISNSQSNDANCYRDMLDDGKPRLGFRITPTRGGKMIVKSICSGSPAMSAGVKPNDQVLKVGDTAINQPEDLKTAFDKYNFGDKTDIYLYRDNSYLTLNVSFPTQDEVTKLQPKLVEKTTQKQTTSVEERLESLSRMLQKGLITKEQFESKREKLLSDI